MTTPARGEGARFAGLKPRAGPKSGRTGGRLKLRIIENRWVFEVNGKSGFTEVIPRGTSANARVETPRGPHRLAYVLDEMLGLGAGEIAAIVRF